MHSSAIVNMLEPGTAKHFKIILLKYLFPMLYHTYSNYLANITANI